MSAAELKIQLKKISYTSSTYLLHVLQKQILGRFPIWGKMNGYSHQLDK